MTFFDDFGREVEQIDVRRTGGNVNEISDILDHGREPDFDKDTLVDQDVTVYGIVGPEQFPLGLVYFILLKRKQDAAIDDPWGVMFPANSPLVRNTLAAVRQNKLPFRGVIQRVTSESNPDQQYYNWRRK